MQNQGINRKGALLALAIFTFIFYTGCAWNLQTIQPPEEETICECIGRFIYKGDLNGDKKDDLIVGVPAAKANRGKLYIFYGGDVSRNTSLSFAHIVIYGENEGDGVGEFVKIGDLNGDGREDLIIGVPTANSNRGELYVFYSGRNSSILQADAIIEGKEPGDVMPQLSVVNSVGDYSLISSIRIAVRSTTDN